MSSQDLSLFCNYFYRCTNIPIRFYENNLLQLQLPQVDEHYDPLLRHYDNLVNSYEKVSYLITKQFVSYGVVKDCENPARCVLIGPITNVFFSRDLLIEVMHDASIPLNCLEQVTKLFNEATKQSFERFLATLCFIHFSINHESISMEDILDYKNEQILIPIAYEHTSKTFEAKEYQLFHNSFQFEKKYLGIVEVGDVTSLKKLLEDPVMINPGVLANSALRQIKNIFIVATTLATRAAIKGGVDSENAYQLSDVYIQQMEKLQSIDEIYNLQYQMLLDFTERVHASKIPSGLSLVVYECINYINTNMNRPITVNDVADHVHRSRSFISRKFMQELGFGINDFISSRKIEEAKSLLAYSGKSLNDISCYLCFSSQSYFQNVFKKKVGMTPNEYRSRNMNKITPY